MVNSKIKPSQLTRAGYSYQDLMCIRILINWFHDPQKYQWIDDPRDIFDSINHARNTEEGIFPLAKWTWPSSFGRWEVDWLSRGYFLPTYSVGDLPFKSTIQNTSSVEFFVGTVSNGIWKYWVDKWYPGHLAGVGNSMGTCMVVSRDFFDRFKEHSDRSFHLIAEMTCIDKRGFNRDQTPVKTYAMLQV